MDPQFHEFMGEMREFKRQVLSELKELKRGQRDTQQGVRSLKFSRTKITGLASGISLMLMIAFRLMIGH